MKPTDAAAVVAGKVTARAIRLLGAGLGSNLPGKIARKVNPSVLSKLAQQVQSGVLAVTGTNGKSTTSGLLASILRTAGFALVHNRQGANLLTGITASLIDAAGWDGRIRADYCLFEVDEAALPLVAKEVKILNIVVTNLFRDQLDRFGELDTTARLIASGIAQNQSHAILNADDPNVSQLATDCQRTFFGIGSVSSASAASVPGAESAAQQQVSAANGTTSPASQSESSLNAQSKAVVHAVQANTKELSYCHSCGCEIVYETVFYGQLGHWQCSSCQYKRPDPGVVANNVEVMSGSCRFLLSINGRTAEITINLPGLFNVYNALAAAAAAHRLGVSIEAIRHGLKNYKTLFGRSEKMVVDGKAMLIQLIKNPAGASQAVSAVIGDENARILIAINDNLADGRDISWLWDADFEQLAAHAATLYVSGQRAEDMAVRLKYAGVSSDLIEVIPRLDKAIDRALATTREGETLWVLPTYTCLLELQKIMKARGHVLSGT